MVTITTHLNTRIAWVRSRFTAAAPLAALLAVVAFLPSVAGAAPPVNLRPAVDLPTAAPISVAIADFDRDGKPDLAAANLYSSSVSVLLGDGAGGFGPATAFTTGDYPWFVATGDFNGDGNPDLVSANDGPNTLSVLMGDGTGSFGPKTDHATGNEPLDVAVADLNKDGHPDLVAANWISSTVSVLLGDGAGGFAPHTQFSTGANPRAVAVGDLNGDGHLDLAAANWTAASVSVLFGDGAGGFSAGPELPTGLECASVAIGDLNGDGNLDLATANFSSNSASVILGDGAGGFASQTEYPGISHPHSVAIGDLNLDGAPDLTLVNLTENAITILPGDGAGSFGPANQFPTGASPRRLVVGELNGDCRPDVVVASLESGAVSVLINDTRPAPAFLFKWGSQGTGDGQFIEPDAIAVGPYGDVYVGEYTGSRMQRFTADGTFIQKWGAFGTADGEFNGVGGLAVGPTGDVYVNDVGNHRIQKFDRNGNFLLKWGSYGTGDGQFIWATLPAADASGNLYVPDNGTHRVQKFDPDGNLLLSWGSFGAGDGEFNQPQSAAVDPSGNVYILEHAGARVQKFTSEGAFILKWGSEGSGPGQFLRPQGIAVDAAGNIYVADIFNSRGQWFSGDGQFLGAWGTYGSADGEFDWPLGVAIHRGDGRAYVLDYHNSRIQAFGSPAANRAPVVGDLADQTIPEGVTFTASATACDADPPLSYSLAPGAPAGAAIDPGSGAFRWTPTEADGPGSYVITVVARDSGSPPLEGQESFTLTVEEVNAPPTLTLPSDLSADEGSTVSFTAVAGDPDLPANTLTFSLLPPVPAGASINPGTGAVTWPTTDDGTATFHLSVADGHGGSATAEVGATVHNAAPSVTITAPAAGSIHAVGEPVSFTATFTDRGSADTHTALWTLGTISLAGTVDAVAHTVQATYTFTAAGVYGFSLRVTDDDGGVGMANQMDGADAMVVVYDPSAGFVTGHGWFDSPPGAFPAQPAQVGKASFGFVSRYQKGAKQPTGETEFKFRVANLDFRSTSYEWLVISGAKAQYKGTGEVNGGGGYGFMLTAIDGGINGGTDRLRIRIWQAGTEALVYDNQVGSPNSADPSTEIGVGQILIQKTAGPVSSVPANLLRQPTGEDKSPSEPLAFGLSQNSPNPFTGTTNIGFTLAEPGRVLLSICDVAGREIARLVDEERRPGRHAVTWTGLDSDGARIKAGMYFCRLELLPARRGATLTAIRKVVLR